MRRFILPALMVLLVGLWVVPADARGSSGSRPYYGGGKHSKSHGGTYAGGKGSSHKGGHYVNPRTGNRYGVHK